MKKIKSILAICGVILLVGLYLSTLIFALIGSDVTLALFRAALFASFILPVLIWTYRLVYRLIKNHRKQDPPAPARSDAPQTSSSQFDPPDTP